MSHFLGNPVLQHNAQIHPSSIGALLGVVEQAGKQVGTQVRRQIGEQAAEQTAEQTAEEAYLARLNFLLHEQCGAEFSVQFFSGPQLACIPHSTLISLAQCYAEVFNESWGEDWTIDTALEEIRHCINCDPAYTPAMSLLFREERVIGFSWGFLMNTESLTETSAPFSSSNRKRHESIQIARYWLTNVGKKNQLLSVRELGVLKEYRQDKAPFVTLPIFEKAKSVGCQVAFLRTKIATNAFKCCLGAGFIPLQFFMEDGLLLMKGSVKYIASVMYASVDSATKRKGQAEIINNIRRYMCE